MASDNEELHEAGLEAGDYFGDKATNGADHNGDCTGHVVPGARRCALGTFSYLVTSTSYFCLSYPNRFL